MLNLSNICDVQDQAKRINVSREILQSFKHERYNDVAMCASVLEARCATLP